MKKERIERDIECQSCGGTGLYSGMGESDDCAVVCVKCKGTGKYHYVFEYTPFAGRNHRADIKRVFAKTCGIKHGADDYTPEGGALIEFSKGGASYLEWLDGVELKPMKDLYCPKMWTTQKWDSAKCKEHCRCGTSIHYCPMHDQMAKCWDEYENSI